MNIDKIPQNIVYAVQRFGYTNPTEAELYLGPLAWKVVTTHGGWSHLCENLGINADVEQEKQKYLEYLQNLRDDLKASFGIPEGELNGTSVGSKATEVNQVAGDRGKRLQAVNGGESCS